MLDLGTVRPGTKLYIPFQTYSSDDPSASMTITGLAVTDIEIYKDGSATQRASDAGYALLDTDGIDFDTITGIHGFEIDLADNTTANFFASGSQYWVVVSSITLDGATINFIAATFRIGYPDAILNTTIATLASQTSFTIASGPAEDDALNGHWAVIHDVASAVQMARVLISDYVGSTKTVTLAAGASFTAAANDNIAIMGPAPLQPTTTGRTFDVTATGAGGVDWGNVENQSTSVNLSSTTTNLVNTLTTYTGNTPQTGDAYAYLGTNLGALGANATEAGGTGDHLTALATAANLAIVDTVVDGIQTDLDNGTDGLGALKTLLDTIDAATDDIGVAGAGLTAIPDMATATNQTAIETDTQNIQSRLPAALVGGLMDSNVGAISTGTTAADNLELMFDGTGYTDSTAPSSRAQVDSIGAASGGSLNYEPDTDNTGGAIKSVTFVGVQTGTFANVDSEDGTLHTIDDTANEIDIVYGWSIGGGRTAVELTWKGYLNSGNDTMNILAYDFVGAGWDTVGTITGQAGTDNITKTISLLSKHTGTGSDLGKVYLRIQQTAQSNPQLNTDQFLVAAVNIGQTIGYADGAIWYDDSASNTNSEAFVDGVADNPVSSWAAVKSLISSVGIQRVRVAAGSSITLDASSDNYVLIGGKGGWSLALGGQSIDGMQVHGAIVTGVGEATTTAPSFVDCEFGAATIPPCRAKNCGFGNASGTFTAAADAGEYLFEDCYSVVPGNGSPNKDFSAVTGATGINDRGHRGGNTYTLTSDCTLSVEIVAGGKQTITTGGGDVEIRGLCREIDITASGQETVQIIAVTGDITIGGATTVTATVLNVWGVSDGVTDNTTGSGATVTDRSVSRASVNAEVDTALSDIGLDHLLSASVTGTDVTDNSIVAYLVSSAATADWDTFVNTDDSLQAISESGGGGPTAAAIADAVWDEAQADHVAAGSFGVIASEIAAIPTNPMLDTENGSAFTAIPWNANWDTEVQSEVNDGLVAFFTSSAQLVDDIWDEQLSGHATAGSSGKALSDAGTAGDPWSTSLPGAYGAGTAGYILGTNLDAVLTARTLATADYFDPATDTVANVTAVATTTTNTDMRGTDNAALADTVEAFFQLTLRQDTAIATDRAVELALINANEGTGAGGYTPVDHSLEAAYSSLPVNWSGLTIDGSGRVLASEVEGGIGTNGGTITTLDALDASQDAQHAATVSAIGALNDLSAAQVNAEVDMALADIHLDHLLAVDYDPTTKPGVATALLNELVESDVGVSRFTANALEQAPSGSGGDATEAKQDTIITLLGTPVADVSTDIAGVQTGVTTLLARVTSTLFSGITSLAEWLGLMAGKQVADATALAEIKATGAGSGTYDESTDSLEAQAEAIAILPTSKDVHINVSSPQLEIVDLDGNLTIHRGDKFVYQFTGLGDISSRNKLFFTGRKEIPTNANVDDKSAAIQVEETAGCVRVNGAAATAGDATFVVDDAVAGDATLTIKKGATNLLELFDSGHYDVQVLDTSDEPTTLTQAKLKIVGDVTRTNS